LLQKDYSLIKKEAETLAAMGIIELHQQNQEIQPITPYERIIFDLSAKAKKQREVSSLRV
jgi:predicted transcriptional regulator